MRVSDFVIEFSCLYFTCPTVFDGLKSAEVSAPVGGWVGLRTFQKDRRPSVLQTPHTTSSVT